MDDRFLENAEEAMREIIDRKVASIRQRPSLKPIGNCYNCGESIQFSKLFCDMDCSNDWEHRRRMGELNRG
jgi:hypothetical protein